MSYVGMSPEVSKSEGRVAQTTNVVIGGTVTDDATDEWLVLDQKVLQNVYSQTMAWLLFTCVNAFVCLSMCLLHVYETWLSRERVPLSNL